MLRSGFREGLCVPCPKTLQSTCQPRHDRISTTYNDAPHGDRKKVSYFTKEFVMRLKQTALVPKTLGR